jgi:hypothetical protein
MARGGGPAPGFHIGKFMQDVLAMDTQSDGTVRPHSSAPPICAQHGVMCWCSPQPRKAVGAFFLPMTPGRRKSQNIKILEVLHDM